MQKLQNNILNVLFDNVDVVFQKANEKKVPLYLDLDCPLPDVSVELGVFFPLRSVCKSPGTTAGRSCRPGLPFTSRPKEWDL